jgi:uncharacterized protein YjcR
MNGGALNMTKTKQSEPKKRGGQPGNRNAAGHGAPVGNNNAETHGAYKVIHLDNLTTEEREYLENITLDAGANMLRELQILYAKERDLIRRIKEYENVDPATLYVDKVIEMLVPKNKEKSEKNKSEFTSTMQTVIKSSPFDRARKLQAEYDKVHGRILKLIDTMRTYEADGKRLDLDERKHKINKMRITGEYDIDPDTGELIDTEDEWDVDG